MQEEALENVTMDDIVMQEATASSLMLPPPRPESRPQFKRLKVYTKEEWEMQKPNIEQLYHVEDKSLPELIQTLGQKFGFFATERQYKRRIKDWGLEKNLKKREMSALIRKQQRRAAEGKKSAFEFKGRAVKPSRIERAQKRYIEFSSIGGSQHRPSTSTPSDLACYTPDSGALLEAPKADKSVPEAGIYWPPSPPPVHNTLNQFSPHHQPTTQSTPGTPGTPYLMSILNSATNDFTGQSPAPFDSTPAPASNHSLNADLSSSPIGFLDGGLNDTSMNQNYFNFPEWNFDGIHTDFMSFQTGSDHISYTPDDYQNLNSEVVPPPRRRYKEEKEEKFRQQLFQSETENGREHPTTIGIRLSLGWVLAEQGRYRAAELLYQQAASASQKVLGSNHETTFKAFQYLLYNFGYQGRYSIAEAHYRSLRRRALTTLGREHVITLRISVDMANILSAMDNWGEAILLEREAFEICSKKLGSEHPDTICCMENLAGTHQHLGQLEEAERLVQEALRLHKIYSTDDLEPLYSKMHLAKICFRQGRGEEGEKLCTEVIKVRSSVLSSEHPDTLHAMETLCHFISRGNRQDECRKMRLEILAKRTKVLGPNHPDTKSIQKALMSIPSLVSSKRTDI